MQGLPPLAFYNLRLGVHRWQGTLASGRQSAHSIVAANWTPVRAHSKFAEDCAYIDSRVSSTDRNTREVEGRDAVNTKVRQIRDVANPSAHTRKMQYGSKYTFETT